MTATPTTSGNFSHHLLLLICFMLITLRALTAVKIVDILIPDKAIIHSRVRLSCLVDLEEDTLYSLKWYLNGSEVASYMPLRNQSFEVFSTNYVPIKITPDSSSTNDLILSDVSWSCEGTWICEVFADKSFQKDEKIVQMTVIAPPTESPVIQSNNDVYDMSDVVNITCTSPRAKPLPVLSWLINGEPAPSDYVLPFDNGTGSQLIFPIEVQHLFEGKPRIQITCEASYNYNHSSFEAHETKEIDMQQNMTSSSNPVRISGLKAAYAVGDEMKLTCSYRGEEDEVVMHWLVNDKRVQPRLVVRYKYHNYIGLKMRIARRDLNHLNQVAVRCVATKFLYRVKRKDSSSGASLLMAKVITTGVFAAVSLLLST